MVYFFKCNSYYLNLKKIVMNSYSHILQILSTDYNCCLFFFFSKKLFSIKMYLLFWTEGQGRLKNFNIKFLNIE